MAEIGFVGLGNMGRPMASRLIAAGHTVRGYDVAAPAREAAGAAGIPVAADLEAAVDGAEAVFTMLPAGDDVRSVYCDNGGLLAAASPDTLLVDCSTIDLETARAVHAEASERGFAMLDAPVSGGVGGAEAGTLTFMVGGEGGRRCARRAPDVGDGPQHRPRRRARQRPGRQDVQQHDTWASR